MDPPAFIQNLLKKNKALNSIKDIERQVEELDSKFLISNNNNIILKFDFRQRNHKSEKYSTK